MPKTIQVTIMPKNPSYNYAKNNPSYNNAKNNPSYINAKSYNTTKSVAVTALRSTQFTTKYSKTNRLLL
jgi:hypothetical protein